MSKTFCFDIDSTITIWNSNRDYENFVADKDIVNKINTLYDDGHKIVLFTARGMTSCGPDKISAEIVPPLLINLEKIGLKYHELITHKPSYDWIIDDKAMNPQEFKDAFNSDELLLKKPYTPEIS